MIVKAVKTDKVVLISNTGKMYKVPVNKIQKGTMKSSGINPIEEKIVNIFSGQEEEQYLFFITDKANVKKIETKDVFYISKNVGTVVMKLKDEEIIWAKLIDNAPISIESGKKTIKLDLSKFKAKGRSAGGVRGFRVKDEFRIKD